MGIKAIILAAGSGSRMKMNTTKQKLVIAEKSVLERAVRVFDASSIVDGIIVVVRNDEVDFATKELSNIKKVEKIVTGGKTRIESVKCGVAAITGEIDFVAIHDAARCLVTTDIINKVFEDAKKYGAATASTRMTDTVKRIDKNGNILETIDRNMLVSVQTPQIFKADLYIKALNGINVNDETITDDNMIFEKSGYTVHCTETGKRNIKLTVQEDLLYADYLLKEGELNND